jgi:heme-degrading monooxygenase HmoA
LSDKLKVEIMLASVTRLRVRLPRYLPAFLWYTFLTRRQLIRATGFRGGRLLLDAKRTFWTLTLWNTERDMKAYRGSNAHAKVMPRLAEWCDEAAYAHWTQNDDFVPSWQSAFEHLEKEGRLSKVAHPSLDHKARRFPFPRLSPLIGADIKPRTR